MHRAHLVGLISAFTLLLRLHRSRGGHRDARAGRPRGSPQPPQPPPGLGAACRERRGAVVSAIAVRTPERHSWSRAAAVDAPSAARTRANGGTNAGATGAGRGATPPSCARWRFVSRWRWCSEAEARWWWQPYYRGLCPSCLAGYTNGFRR